MGLTKADLAWDVLTIPNLALPSVMNLREHWAKRHRRTQEQRFVVFCCLLEAWPNRRPRLPCTITLIRQAPRALDTDNLAAALKACQDGVADWLVARYLAGQDRQPGLAWRYAQQRGAPALVIQIREESTC